MKIPYSRQWISAGDIEACADVLRSDFITQGTKVHNFEKALASYCDARYAIAVSSGTAALHLACIAAGIRPGDEVITSPISFAASANCVLYCGGRPTFADVQEDTANIDPREIEKKITKRTKAVIPVDFAGHPCDMDEIGALARKHRLVVIEDASHALGAEYRHRRIGGLSDADMTVFSFHPVKSITTGEGGAILTNNGRLRETLAMLRTHGITRDPAKLERRGGPWYYEMQDLGFNYRITDIQCALGMSQLKRLGQFVERRREIASVYDKAFRGIGEIDTPRTREYVESSFHLYVVRLSDRRVRSRRAFIFHFLNSRGIYPQVHYIPIYLQPYYRDNLGYKEGLCPRAESYYEEAISLPVYPKMRKREINYVIENFISAVRRAKH
jgi:UDP-4-amino-4,6-dideoxy-N-acetyl-beta-L-altrosamine transaminase